jgi:hypothetical protein
MKGLRHVLTVGAFVVAVSVVAAGPALAAKGGNSDNAHVCQQGGFANRFDGETGLPFTNAGDCANNGAKDQPSAFLALDVSDSPYPCTNTDDFCWGRLAAGGLADGASWEVENASTHVVVASDHADSAGNVNDVILNLPCPSFVVQISSTTSLSARLSQLGDPQGVC